MGEEEGGAHHFLVGGLQRPHGLSAVVHLVPGQQVYGQGLSRLDQLVLPEEGEIGRLK